MCQFPTCNDNPEANGWCIRHQIYSGKDKPKARPYYEKKGRLNPNPPKLQQWVDTIAELTKKYLLTRKECKMLTPWCSGQATMINHGNTKLPTDVFKTSLWIPSCKECNDYWINTPEFIPPKP